MQRNSLYQKVALLHAALCIGLALLAGIRGIPAQDASAYLAAGKLVLNSEYSVYPEFIHSLPQFSSAYTNQYCALVQNSQFTCEGLLVPFVSPPPMLIFTEFLALLPSSFGIFFFQVLSGVALAFSTLLVFRKVTEESPHASRPLALCYLVLLPFSVNSIEHGQTSAWLCALVAAGFALERSRRATEIFLSILLALSSIAKFSPIVFLALFGSYRYWRIVFVTLLLLSLTTLLTLVLLPWELFSQYLTFLPNFSEYIRSYPYNTSVDSTLAYLLSEQGGVLLHTLSFLKSAAVFGCLLFVWLKRVSFRDMWLLSWLGWLVVNPINWWHYNWIGVVAIAGILGDEGRARQTFWLLVFWCAPLTLGLPILLHANPMAKAVGSIFVIGTFLWGASIVLHKLERKR